MFPSLSLQSIIAVWRDRLKNDYDLYNYCHEHFDTAPKIVVGCKAAAAGDCPVIVIRPGGKMEGTGKLEYPWDIPKDSGYEFSPYNIYKVFVDWAIVNSSETEIDEGNSTVSEQVGLTEIDELGQIIIAALGEASPSNPVTRLEYSIDGTWFPMLVGKMMLKTHIPPVPGVEMKFTS